MLKAAPGPRVEELYNIHQHPGIRTKSENGIHEKTDFPKSPGRSGNNARRPPPHVEELYNICQHHQ